MESLAALILISLMMVFMQGIFFYKNVGENLNKITHIHWFTLEDDIRNRQTWTVWGKKIFWLWPFIMFTGFFHFCHSVFGLLVGMIIGLSSNVSDPMKAIYALAGSLVYSCIFEIGLKVFKHVGNI